MPKKIREICKKHFSKNLVPWIKKILPNWKVQQNSLIAKLIPKAFKLINRM